MTYINGSLVRLRVFDGAQYSNAIYEISSTLSVQLGLEEVTTEAGNGWREFKPFGLDSWNMTLNRFYDDDGGELNFNEVYDIITSGQKIDVSYLIGQLEYRGKARIASDSLPAVVGSPISSSINLQGDGALNKVEVSQLTIGDAVFFGYVTGLEVPTGALSPDVINGVLITDLCADDVNTNIYINANDAQIPGISTVTLEILDSGLSAPLTAPYNAVDGYYEIADLEYNDFFRNNAGNQFDIILTYNT